MITMLMTLFFSLIDDIGRPLLDYANAFVAFVNEIRAKNKILSAVLWLPLWLFRWIIATTLAPWVIGGANIRDYWIPLYIKRFFAMLIHSIPNNIRCYSKTGMLIYFVDWYCLTMCLHRIWVFSIHPARLMRAMLLLSYFSVKLIMLILPFMWLSPFDRYPTWFLGFALAPLEMQLAQLGIQSIGRGIRWNTGKSFYHHWGPHYRYRRMTTNRKLTLEFSEFAYPVFKMIVLCSFTCRRPNVITARLKYPYVPTRASVADPTPPYNAAEDISQMLEKTKIKSGGVTAPGLPDYDYITALIEPDTVVNMRYGVLFLLALSSLSVYSIILAGWASNSKYAFIGALRSAAQMISYEVAISLILLPVVLMAGSLNLTMITYVQSITVWFLFPLLPASILFLIAMLAETNRTPFDLPEAEAELVAGYNVDYSSLPFAMFFLGEYCNMILISTLYCLLFLGGGLNSFDINTALILSLKAAVIWVFFVNVRATLPRYRYDQLMDIGWKVFLPIAGGFLVFIFGLLLFFDAIPYTTELPFNTWSVTPADSAFFETPSLSRHAPTFPRGPYYAGVDYLDDILHPYNPFTQL